MTLTPSKVNQGAAGSAAWPVTFLAVPTIVEKQDQPAATSATWTSATGANTAVTVATTGYGTATVSIQVPSTVTAGVITLEVSDDAGTTYYPAGAVRVDNAQQENIVALAQTPGLALNRMYAISVDAMTQVRARLSTVITGTGNVLVRVGTVAGGIEPFVAQRSRKVATYRAVYRTTTAGTRVLAPAAFTAGARKQFATIHHAASAVKTVRLRSVQFSMESTSVAGRLHVDLVRITAAPATGNPAITPGISDNADAAAEATCLALPTTAGTEGTVFSYQPYNLGVTGTRSVISPPVVQPWVELLSKATIDDESKAPVIRAGVLEGWAVTVEAEAATSAAGFVMIEFTEESP